ncbi:P-loop containing nucleoside triphosphate hydrolase protein [Mycena sp. CBHHK59/15]|nr:P-loop containing nucleoside triphosphate hydrolase protein [Mycena sp. CBHHK59/15]
MSIAMAPVIGHFGATISGLVSIRAYGNQDASVAQSLDRRINDYTRTATVFYNLNRWIGIRLPFNQHDDAALNAALRAAGLFSLQDEADADTVRITLDTPMSARGGDQSMGQRQISTLARALLRWSKLLISDEATSSIDYRTDAIIQSSLRHELGKDVTLIVIAHRASRANYHGHG